MNAFYKFLLWGGLWSEGEDLHGGKAHLWKSKGHLLWDQLQLWQRPGGDEKDGKSEADPNHKLGTFGSFCPSDYPNNFPLTVFEDHTLKDFFISLTPPFSDQLLQIPQILHYSKPSRSWVTYKSEEAGSYAWISMINKGNLVSKCPNRSTKLVLIDSPQTIWNIYIYFKNYTSGLYY